jgi:hypothetical protein
MGGGEYLLFASYLHVLRFIQEAQKMKTSILWNVWVLLAMPVVWMSWWVPKKRISLSHTLTYSQGYDFIFIRHSFFCVAEWVGFRPVGPSTAWRSSCARSTYRDYMCFIIGTWIYGYDYYNIEKVWISPRLHQNVYKFGYGE